MYRYRDGVIERDSGFWKITALVFMALSVGLAVLALHCSKTMNCSEITVYDGKIIKCNVGE